MRKEPKSGYTPCQLQDKGTTLADFLPQCFLCWGVIRNVFFSGFCESSCACCRKLFILQKYLFPFWLIAALTLGQVEQMAGLLAQVEGQSVLNASDQALGWRGASLGFYKAHGLFPARDRKDFEIL